MSFCWGDYSFRTVVKDITDGYKHRHTRSDDRPAQISLSRTGSGWVRDPRNTTSSALTPTPSTRPSVHVSRSVSPGGTNYLGYIYHVKNKDNPEKYCE